MSSSIHNIVTTINSSLSGLVKGGVWHGVASNATRNGITQPVVDEKYAGADDKFPVVAYHKLGSLTSRSVEGNGYGRDAGTQTNVYTNSLVVFLNRTKCKLYPDELLLHIQANLPEQVAMEPYTRIYLTITNTQLDSETVYAQEYVKSKFELKANQYLFRINYTVETTFKKGCFKTCPQN